MAKMKRCPKCAGSGYLPQYQHIMRGECIPCRGTGEVEEREERAPSRAAPKTKQTPTAEILEFLKKTLDEVKNNRGHSEAAVDARHSAVITIGYWFAMLATQEPREFAVRVEARLRANLSENDFWLAMEQAQNMGWERKA